MNTPTSRPNVGTDEQRDNARDGQVVWRGEDGSQKSLDWLAHADPYAELPTSVKVLRPRRRERRRSFLDDIFDI